MKLDPSTTRDFIRIYNHHDYYSGAERAGEIEDQLYEDAESCDTVPTANFRGLNFKRVRNGYRFFYATDSGVNVIYAVYHERENWQNLIDGRFEGFSDA